MKKPGPLLHGAGFVRHVALSSVESGPAMGIIVVDLVAPVFFDQEDFIGQRGETLDLHARRTDWHMWYRQPNGIGTFLQQSLDVRRRNVSFDNVAIDDGRVAGLEFFRNVVVGPDLLQVDIDRDQGGLETVGFQILSPFAAAVSKGRLIDGDLQGGADTIPKGDQLHRSSAGRQQHPDQQCREQFDCHNFLLVGFALKEPIAVILGGKSRAGKRGFVRSPRPGRGEIQRRRYLFRNRTGSSPRDKPVRLARRSYREYSRGGMKC